MNETVLTIGLFIVAFALGRMTKPDAPRVLVSCPHPFSIKLKKGPGWKGPEYPAAWWDEPDLSEH